MAQRAPELEGIIERYREALAKLGVRAERVYLYGSYKDGTQREGSDIDLVVVSSDFKRLDDLKRLETLGVAAARILEPIEAAGFTPEEVEEGDLTTFWKHVLENEAVLVCGEGQALRRHARRSEGYGADQTSFLSFPSCRI